MLAGAAIGALLGAGAALLMLVEHRWLIPLRDAIRAQGGIVYAQEFLSPETLTAIGSELALLAEIEAGIEEWADLEKVSKPLIARKEKVHAR
jgi:hypothetical protein